MELTLGFLEPVPETPKSVPQRVLSYVGTSVDLESYWEQRGLLGAERTIGGIEDY